MRGKYFETLRESLEDKDGPNGNAEADESSPKLDGAVQFGGNADVAVLDAMRAVQLGGMEVGASRAQKENEDARQAKANAEAVTILPCRQIPWDHFYPRK